MRKWSSLGYQIDQGSEDFVHNIRDMARGKEGKTMQICGFS